MILLCYHVYLIMPCFFAYYIQNSTTYIVQFALITTRNLVNTGQEVMQLMCTLHNLFCLLKMMSLLGLLLNIGAILAGIQWAHSYTSVL